jgi:hypothetical protein
MRPHKISTNAVNELARILAVARSRLQSILLQ